METNDRTTRVKLMAEAGMSQYRIAKELGVSRQRVHQIISTIRESDPLFMIIKKCPVCGKDFEISGSRRVWCSPECAKLGANKIRCECGGLKSKSAKRCRQCERREYLALAERCAAMYQSGMTGAEISRALGGKRLAACLALARLGGAVMRHRGPRKKIVSPVDCPATGAKVAESSDSCPF